MQLESIIHSKNKTVISQTQICILYDNRMSGDVSTIHLYSVANNLWAMVPCFPLFYFMRFSTSKQLHINDQLKAHLGYKSCPKTLGTEDPVYGGTRTHDLVVESPVP